MAEQGCPGQCVLVLPHVCRGKCGITGLCLLPCCANEVGGQVERGGRGGEDLRIAAGPGPGHGFGQSASHVPMWGSIRISPSNFGLDGGGLGMV